MLRNPASRAFLRSLVKPTHQRQTPPFPRRNALQTAILSSKICTVAAKRPVLPAHSLLRNPVIISLKRTASQTKWDKPDIATEKKIGQQKLEPHPEIVSVDSSVRAITGEVGVEDPGRRGPVHGGVRDDLQTIADTFSLKDVPPQAFYLGMAGVLPYLATAMSTIFCAREINHAAVAGTGLVMKGETAEALLHILEPIQIGYGAVIISFLGAIHWGLEFASYGGKVGLPRYSVGVVAPAVAWPTVFLPVEYALIVQFVAFNFLYYADSRASRKGWAPPWYGIYRFVLTFVVGASIVFTLIGRGDVADKVQRMPGPADRVRALRRISAGGELKKDEEKEEEAD